LTHGECVRVGVLERSSGSVCLKKKRGKTHQFAMHGSGQEGGGRSPGEKKVERSGGAKSAEGRVVKSRREKSHPSESLTSG